MMGDVEIEIPQDIPDQPVVIGEIIGDFQLMADPAEWQTVLFIQFRKRIVRQRMQRQQHKQCKNAGYNDLQEPGSQSQPDRYFEKEHRNPDLVEKVE